MFNDNEFWESADDTENFFSMNVEENEEDPTSAETVIKKITEDEETPTEETNEESSASDKTEDLFGESSEESEEEISQEGDEDSEESNEVQKGTNYSTLLTLKEKGLIDFELDEGEELTEDLAEELLEDKFEETLEEKIKEKLESLPDETKEFIQFALKGGSLYEYVKEAYNEGTSLTEDLDLEEESNQELVVRQLLTEEGYDEETLETQIEFLKDSGKLKNFAEKKFEKWKEEVKSTKKDILKKQEEKRQALKESIRKAKKSVSEKLSSKQELGGLSFSKEEEKILPSYINDRTVKLQNGVEISELQKDLYYDLPKNDIAMIQLAILMKNRNEDGTFNFEDIAKKVKTQVTKEIKQNIRRNKTAIPSTGSKSNKGGRTLADYFK